MLNFFKKLFQLQLRSKTALELYIASKNPQNALDIERFSMEYQDKVNRGYFSV
jgi:hypothetical protein